MSGFYTRTEGRPEQSRGVIPRFHMEAVEDPIASQREGYQCWRQEERVQLIIPGSPNSPVERVNDSHRAMWPKEYEAFRRGEEAVTDGIPLEMWPALKKPQVLELKAMGFRTVEDCASMADTAMQRVKFGQRVRDLAKAYLDEAYAQAELQKAMSERDARTSEVAELRAKVDELSNLLTRVHSQMAAMGDRKPDLVTTAPMHMEPAQQVYASDAGGGSSLADLPEVRRRPGRPTNAERAAREAGGI